MSDVNVCNKVFNCTSLVVEILKYCSTSQVYETSHVWFSQDKFQWFAVERMLVPHWIRTTDIFVKFPLLNPNIPVEKRWLSYAKQCPANWMLRYLLKLNNILQERPLLVGFQDKRSSVKDGVLFSVYLARKYSYWPVFELYLPSPAISELYKLRPLIGFRHSLPLPVFVQEALKEAFNELVAIRILTWWTSLSQDYTVRVWLLSRQGDQLESSLSEVGLHQNENENANRFDLIHPQKGNFPIPLTKGETQHEFCLL